MTGVPLSLLGGPLWGYAGIEATSGLGIPASSAYGSGFAPPPRPEFVSGLPVSSPYGLRVHPIDGTARMHHGLDLAVPRGTIAQAVEDGVVVAVQMDASRPEGLAVWLRGRNGLIFGYLHLDVVAVEVGQQVRAGTALGLTGATGAVTGPHLHFAVRAPHGAWLDPASLYPPGTFGG